MDGEERMRERYKGTELDGILGQKKKVCEKK